MIVNRSFIIAYTVALLIIIAVPVVVAVKAYDRACMTNADNRTLLRNLLEAARDTSDLNAGGTPIARANIARFYDEQIRAAGPVKC